MKFHIGTSGYSYAEWKGKFYPEKTKPADMLPFYATQFGAVEINYTFYRMPKPEMVQSWTARVPPAFQFVLKAPRRITHDRRLADIEETLGYFLNAAMSLGDHRGPLLFQLPPNFKRDDARLETFLAQLPATVQAAFEFRNASWFNDAVFAILRSRQAALCIADTEDGIDTPFVATAPWGYFRLRDVDYADGQLESWITRARAQGWSEAFVFFKHEDEARGPEFARRFTELAACAP